MLLLSQRGGLSVTQVNYKAYREHEAKAFFEWLQVSGAKVATIGMLGPLPGQSHGMDLDLTVLEHPWEHQSAAFVVISKPGHSSNHLGLSGCFH